MLHHGRTRTSACASSRRDTMTELPRIGRAGRSDEFFGVHSIAVRLQGNIYTTETYEGKRRNRSSTSRHRKKCGPATRAWCGRREARVRPLTFQPGVIAGLDPASILPRRWTRGSAAGDEQGVVRFVRTGAEFGPAASAGISLCAREAAQALRQAQCAT